MKTVLSLVFSLFVLVSSSNAFAYASISERILNTSLLGPLDLVPMDASSSGAQINLLKWNENPQDPPAPPEKYNRIMQFGSWIVLGQTPDDCIDVRGRVLIRDSLSPVGMRPETPCKVGTGLWHDPYTNKDFQSAADIQIDHFVPLKDVYTNGGWRWNYQQRCTYGNYLGYRDHLKTVEGSENQFKSDHNPGEYMPPNQAYKCYYLKNWLVVKLIWKLGMQRAEAQAIKQLINQEKCNPADFVFPTEELRNQRATIIKSLPLCPEVPPPPTAFNP